MAEKKKKKTTSSAKKGKSPAKRTGVSRTKKTAASKKKKVSSGSVKKSTSAKKTSAKSKKTPGKKRRKAVSPLQKQTDASYSGFSKDSFPAWKTTTKRREKHVSILTPFATKMLLGVLAAGLFVFLFVKLDISSHIRRERTKEEIVWKRSVATSSTKKTIKKKLVRSVSKKKVPKTKIPAAKPAVIKPAPVITRVPKKGPFLVFVLDDLGYTKKDQGLLEDLGDNVTYAILPLLSYSNHFSDLSIKTDAEVILHLPIESLSGPEKDPGKVSPNMTAQEVLSQLNRDLSSVSAAIGVNNHKGSLGTSDRRLMAVILKKLRSKGMFFLDSYTTKDSVVTDLCKNLGMPILERDVFLDNINESVAIKEQIEKMLVIAKKKGYAIGIGHYRPETLKTLKKEMPQLKNRGFKVISLSDLIVLKKKKVII